jgi:transcriptional regulator with XRE-family HTH domain
MREVFAARHMGKIIYAYRIHPFHGKAISQETVARWACISQAQLSRIESGPPLHDLKRLMQWAHTLRIPARLLWFRLDEPSDSAVSTGESLYLGQAGEVSRTFRRDFVALGSFTIASHLLGMLDSEFDLIHMTLDRGTTSEERTSHLEGVADDLGVQVVRIAPLAVLNPALNTLHSIRSLLEERQPTRHQIRLVRASAKLSTIVGEIMFNVGEFQKAHEWYKAAEHAAYDTGDRYLADIALAGQAYLPTYSDDPRGVLSLLEPRLDSNPSASPAIAWLWGFRARAHAVLNEPDEFKHSIDRAQECLERSPAELVVPGIFSFLPEKLAFYEATGAVRLNEPGRAMAAADRALSLYDLSETTEPTLAKLERASALAEAGEVPEACRIAKTALLDPNTYHGLTVRAYADKFDYLIRAIQSPETHEWREVRADIHGPKIQPRKPREK